MNAGHTVITSNACAAHPLAPDTAVCGPVDAARAPDSSPRDFVSVGTAGGACAASSLAPAALRWYALCVIGAHTDRDGRITGFWMNVLSSSTSFRETLRVYCENYLFSERVSLHVCSANPETIPAGNMRALPQMKCKIRDHTLKFRCRGHSRPEEFEIFEKTMQAIRPQYDRYAASMFSERMRTNCFLSCLFCTNARLQTSAWHAFDLDTGLLTTYQRTANGDVRLPPWR